MQSVRPPCCWWSKFPQSAGCHCNDQQLNEALAPEEKIKFLKSANPKQIKTTRNYTFHLLSETKGPDLGVQQLKGGLGTLYAWSKDWQAVRDSSNSNKAFSAFSAAAWSMENKRSWHQQCSKNGKPGVFVTYQMCATNVGLLFLVLLLLLTKFWQHFIPSEMPVLAPNVSPLISTMI